MEDNTKLIEGLLENASEYGKTTLELVKLKIIDTTSDKISTFIPHAIVVTVIFTFMLFINLGAAFWLGQVFGQIFLGFLMVAAFYFFVAFVMHFFMRKWLKRVFYDYIIRIYRLQETPDIQV